ncbi:hypothetical protein MNEG_15805 [Monoraphidium neglectum]|jgi:hypothetical protein|uniref:Uncharacterized protein n=1 Tax=Monoraphidium neglectum TaxID=145388 RepID=A0A0D2K7R6_9CHLO|nr:hypothetical protein MNEG_15805 [Monoraphidium neglectum]KIY92158.1 hypothetical protein MNEG_15805 [Monoraphidium neglectum]|eukprot:XP_013891178.1 hypothetical protein MNEG_15805 [Monoraphidium neglectum]
MGGGRRLSFRNGGARYSRLPNHLAANGHCATNGGGAAACDKPAGALRAWAARVPPGRWLCGAAVALPWLVLLLVGCMFLGRAQRQLPVPRADLPGAKQCVGWRETYFCHPFA